VALTTYTKPLNINQVDLLKDILEKEGFEFISKPYTHYAARKNKLNISVYEKGPKVLIQGANTEDFIKFTLEPKILGQAELGYEELHNPEWFEPHFGIDESGKGDVLGPLVIAGAYSDASISRTLLDIGAMDSKAIKSRTKIGKLASEIKAIPGLHWDIILLAPETYNRLYDQFTNLNLLLAWGHASIIENLQKKRPDCPNALSDKFANSKVLDNAINRKGININLTQRTKAESDPAVAAASILARDAFVSWMEDAGKTWGEKVPLGAGPAVNSFIQNISDSSSLNSIGKLHFKNFSAYRNQS